MNFNTLERLETFCVLFLEYNVLLIRRPAPPNFLSGKERDVKHEILESKHS